VQGLHAVCDSTVSRVVEKYASDVTLRETLIRYYDLCMKSCAILFGRKRGFSLLKWIRKHTRSYVTQHRRVSRYKMIGTPAWKKYLAIT